QRMTIPAVRMLEGHGLSLKDGAGPSAYRPPLYILWLAGNYALFGKFSLLGPSVLQALASTGNIVLLYLLTLQIWKRRDIAFGSALILAVHPYSVYHDTQLYHTFLSTGLLLSAFLLLFRGIEKRSWKLLAGSGAFFGLCILVISTIVPFVGALILAGVFFCLRRDKRFVLVGGFILGLSLAWSPWVIRNAVAFGHFIPLTTESGVTLWMGNNPVSRELLKTRDHEDSPVPRGTKFNIPEFYGGCKPVNWCKDGISEFDENKELTAMAMHWITSHPGSFLSLTAWRLKGIWSPFLTPKKNISGSVLLNGLIRYGYVCWNLFLAACFLAALPLVRRSKKGRELLVSVALVGSGTLAYALFLFYTKYRMPFEPLLYPFCGAGLVILYERIRRITTKKSPSSTSGT
ncbi:MAG: glycosyltransferase family 39 protein, partial [bacterium]|nr:glycosyltransferase family 39 protein [bacterium]